jgi:hypothetical protein
VGKLHLSLCLFQVLAKIGERLGDVQVQVPPAGAAAAAAVRPPAADVPDIDNLVDAAKYGDLEAVEDFIAIGKVSACCPLSTVAATGSGKPDACASATRPFQLDTLSLQRFLVSGRAAWC